MAIRRYCEERRMTFNHHVVENITPNTYLVLERVVEDAHFYQAIAMCSIGMLPADTKYRSSLIGRCLDHGVSVHFVFEQTIVKSHSDLPELNELLSLIALTSKADYRREHLRQFLHTHQ